MKHEVKYLLYAEPAAKKGVMGLIQKIPKHRAWILHEKASISIAKSHSARIEALLHAAWGQRCKGQRQQNLRNRTNSAGTQEWPSHPPTPQS
jgi:hypothetical protein